MKREEALRRRLLAVAENLGYGEHAEDLELRLLRADRRWIHYRSGKHFRTEAVCFLYQRRPRSRMRVEYLGSPRLLNGLLGTELDGLAVTQNLFAYQFYFRQCDAGDVLPAELDVSTSIDLEPLLAALRKEMQEVEHELWPSIASSWRRVVGSSPVG